MLDLTQPDDVLKKQIRQAGKKLEAAKIKIDGAKTDGPRMVYRELVRDQEWIIDMIRAELARRRKAAESAQNKEIDVVVNNT